MSDHPAKSDVFQLNILSSDRQMRQRREGIKDWSLPRKGRDPENPAPHYDPEDGFAVFASDTERTEWLAKSQDTSRPYIREDKD